MSEVKIVLNVCYGGFGLSKKAHKLYKTLSGKEIEDARKLSRHDPYLVEVVETLGAKANGIHSKLDIETVKEGTRYSIHEYDGIENLHFSDHLGQETFIAYNKPPSSDNGDSP